MRPLASGLAQWASLPATPQPEVDSEGPAQDRGPESRTRTRAEPVSAHCGRSLAGSSEARAICEPKKGRKGPDTGMLSGAGPPTQSVDTMN